VEAILKRGGKAERLRRELQEGESRGLRRRRWVIGLSLVGIGAMAAVSLFQTGVVGHLPDPPVEGFDSDKVNSSETAYMLGVPDGTLSLASLAANVPLAAFGGDDRARATPLVPLFAAGKSLVEAAVAGWYFYQMPRRRNAGAPTASRARSRTSPSPRSRCRRPWSRSTRSGATVKAKASLDAGSARVAVPTGAVRRRRDP
jgi:hypothetical protein